MGYPCRDGSPWLVWLSRWEVPWTRLVCFPFAGGSAGSYRRWTALLPSGVDLLAVQLPGREMRFAEEPMGDLSVVLHEVTACLRGLDGRTPTVFFGHSLGALLAYEASRRLRGEGFDRPKHLVVSGCWAPHLPDQEPPISRLPEPAFLSELRRLNGTDREILDNREVIGLLMPMLRADFGLAESYRYRPGQPLPCSITALCGTEDPRVAPEAMEGWRAHTSAGFALRLFPGDHFFLASAVHDVVAAVIEIVRGEG